MNTDCEVCKKLIKEKHRNIIWWKISCIIFAALAIVLGILYFGSGAVVTETTITIRGTEVTNGGDNGTIVIGSEDSVINGDITQVDYTPVICISVVACVAIILIGGVLIANHIKKDL